MRKLPLQDKHQLTLLVKRHGIDAVLKALITICDSQAELVAVAWHDIPAAREWATVGAAIEDARPSNPDLW